MAGNAMHCNVAGLVLLFCWTQVTFDPVVATALYRCRQYVRDSQTRTLRSLPRVAVTSVTSAAATETEPNGATKGGA